ncbi:MAG: DUF2304 domain-containing protein [Clostridiales bacterium]|nr:DUF2304 domain-containing protein [Clostridiales bacterium]
MTVFFRLLLLIVSIGTLIFVLGRVRKAQAQIESVVFWILFMLGLVAVSAFPGAVVYVSGLIGVESPANFVFLCIIFLLLLKVFNMSLLMSKLEYQIRQLTQRIALDEENRGESAARGVAPPVD